MNHLPSMNKAMIIQHERQGNTNFDEEAKVFARITNNRKNFGIGKGKRQ